MCQIDTFSRKPPSRILFLSWNSLKTLLLKNSLRLSRTSETLLTSYIWLSLVLSSLLVVQLNENPGNGVELSHILVWKQHFDLLTKRGISQWCLIAHVIFYSDQRAIFALLWLYLPLMKFYPEIPQPYDVHCPVFSNNWSQVML